MIDTDVRFVLVDDDQAANFLNKRLIESVSEDVGILSVLSAAEALKHFEIRKSFAQNKEREVVLLDINMPAMDGLEFLESLEPGKFDFEGITFIMLTSSNNLKDIEKAKSLNVHGYITKPLSREKILKILENLNSGEYDRQK